MDQLEYTALEIAPEIDTQRHTESDCYCRKERVWLARLISNMDQLEYTALEMAPEILPVC